MGFVKARLIHREGYLYNFGGKNNDGTKLCMHRRMKISENQWTKVLKCKGSSIDKTSR
jgi:hypothetical protein